MSGPKRAEPFYINRFIYYLWMRNSHCLFFTFVHLMMWGWEIQGVFYYCPTFKMLLKKNSDSLQIWTAYTWKRGKPYGIGEKMLQSVTTDKTVRGIMKMDSVKMLYLESKNGGFGMSSTSNQILLLNVYDCLGFLACKTFKLKWLSCHSAFVAR